MEAVKEKLSAVGKKIHTTETPKVIRDVAPFHSSLTDVGLYSFGVLCAVSMAKLFDEECHEEFKKKALEKILLDLGQPKQTHDSMFAILEGEIMDSSDTFVDELLKEEVLRQSRQPLVEDMITLAISEGCYDARMRVLIKHVAWQLRVTWDEVEDIEKEMAETIEYNTYVMTEEQMKEKAKKSRNRKMKRYALIGLATVGGGAIIGLTGGLAAPLVAAGAGAIIGGAGAAALGSAAGVAIIGSLFGMAGAGLTGYKMKRRVGALEEFAFEALTLRGSKYDPGRTVKQLHITIAVTGWINSNIQDFRHPWSALAESQEQYSLRWESEYLYQLGEAFDGILQAGLSLATTEALKYTILSGIITAIAWPAALIGVAGAIDNPWHVCTQRATEAGKQLAEVLLSREQGNRPATLIGFSMGARVIFSCLEELCKRKGHEGLIEDVILLGAPVSADVKHWKSLTRVVAGKIINGYARGDWLLKFLYRTASVTFSVAGLGPVKWQNRRMHNIDLSDVIDGHMDYMKNIDIVLKAVGVRTKDELKKDTMTSYSRKLKGASSDSSPDHDNSKGPKPTDNSTSSSKDLSNATGTIIGATSKEGLTNDMNTGIDGENGTERQISAVTDKLDALIGADSLDELSDNQCSNVPSNKIQFKGSAKQVLRENQKSKDSSLTQGNNNLHEVHENPLTQGIDKQPKGDLAQNKCDKTLDQHALLKYEKDVSKKPLENRQSPEWESCSFTDSNPSSEDES